ncbi:cAMP-binding protein [Azospirillaceae bacterium]
MENNIASFIGDNLNKYPKITFPRGHIIFQDGATAEQAYIIESGIVQISKVNAAGEGMVFGLLKAGSMFGELALITKKPRSATATAMSDTVCRVIAKNDFDEMMTRLDPFTRKVMQQLIRTLYRLTNLHVISIVE